MRDEAEAIKNLYWPEEDGRATGGRVEVPSDRPRTGRELGDAFRYSRASLRESLGLPGFVATRGPISFNQEAVQDDPPPEPGEGSLTNTQVQEEVAESVRPGISVDDPRVGRPGPDRDAPARYRMVPDCGTDHGDLGALSCPWCTVSMLTGRFDEHRSERARAERAELRLHGAVLTCEDHREDASDYEGCPVCNESDEEARARQAEWSRMEHRHMVEAANRLLQVWNDLDTSSARIPRHFRIRMENAASRLRTART